jgi:hypothetical protein
MNGKRQVWLAIALAIVFAITRWPGLMPMNFSAAYAFMFCAGVFFPARLWLWLPIVTIFCTDIILNVFFYGVAPITVESLGNYLGFICLLFLGRAFRGRAWWLVIGASVIGAVLFYLVTNSVSWLRDPGYAKTFLGWIQALTTGLPGFPPTWLFFKSTLFSSTLFTALFTGVFNLSAHLESAQEKEAAEATDESEARGAEPEESNA